MPPKFCRIFDDGALLSRIHRQCFQFRLRPRTPHHEFRRYATYKAPISTDHPQGLNKWKRRTRIIGQIQDRHLYPESLRATLDGHREANRASLIRKIESEDIYKTSRRLTVNERDLLQQISARQNVKNNNAVLDEAALATRQASDKKLRLKRRNVRNAQEYSGEYRSPLDSWALKDKLESEHRYPWLSYLHETKERTSQHWQTAAERLTSEIYAFADYVSPTSHERAAADYAIQDIRSAFTDCSDGTMVEFRGSRSTKFALPLSDIDCNVHSPLLLEQRDCSTRGPSPTRPQARKKAMRVLEETKERLQRTGKVHMTRYVPARIPLVEAVHMRTGLTVQAQCSLTPSASEEYVTYYAAEYPSLRALYFLVRMVLAIRGLSTTIDGGLSSYTITIMIVASLKFHEGTNDRNDLGAQFLQFLELFSDLDFYTTGVSVEPPERFPKRPLNIPMSKAQKASTEPYILARQILAQINPLQPSLMCLQDPANVQNDLGQKAHKIKHIQATFMRILWQLRSDTAAWDKQRPSEGAALLALALGADYREFNQKRARLVRWISDSHPVQ